MSNSIAGTLWAACGSRVPLPSGWRRGVVVAVAVLLLAAPFSSEIGGSSVVGGADFAARVLLLAVLASAQEMTRRGGIASFTLAPYAVLGGTAVALANARFGVGVAASVVGWMGALFGAMGVEAVLALATWRVGRRVFALASLGLAVLLPLLVATTDMAGAGEPLAIHLPTGHDRLGYGLLLLAAVGLWLLMLRWINSPFGRVLPALRDAPRLAETIGYRVALYRSLASAMAAAIAVSAGGAFALWQQSSMPVVPGSLDLALQVLAIGLVGGLGTVWAAPVGAVLVVAGWTWLPALLRVGAGRVPDVPWLAALLADPSPQRWMVAGLIGAAGWAIGGVMTRRHPDCRPAHASASTPRA